MTTRAVHTAEHAHPRRPQAQAQAQIPAQAQVLGAQTVQEEAAMSHVPAAQQRGNGRRLDRDRGRGPDPALRFHDHDRHAYAIEWQTEHARPVFERSGLIGSLTKMKLSLNFILDGAISLALHQCSSDCVLV